MATKITLATGGVLLVHLREEQIMPTTKKRIQIPVSDTVHKELTKLAKKRGLSISSLTYDLVAEALELQEDVYFSRSGDDALESEGNGKLVGHDDAWS